MVAVLVVAGVFLAWLLGTESGLGFLGDRVSRLVLEKSGWQLEIATLRLELGSGGLELEGVALGAPEQTPLLRVERISARVDLDRLLAGELVLPELEVLSPVLDLAAPRPEAAAADPEQGDRGDFSLPLDIESWRLRGGEVLGNGSRGWLAGWTAAALDAEGSLVADAMDVHLQGGELRLERAQDGRILDVALEGRLRGPLLGPYTVDRVKATGEALDARLSGTVAASPEHPFVIDFSARLDPSLLVPGVARQAGLLETRGHLDFRGGEGEVTARADAFPVAVFEPFMDPGTFESAFGRADLVDLEADVHFDELSADATRGSARAALRRGEVRLLDLAAETVSRENGLALEVDAELLPGRAGRRVLSGILAAPSWRQLAGEEGRLEDARFELVAADAAALLDELARHWPKLLESSPRVPAGALEVTATASGALLDPRLDAEALWRPAAGGEVRLEGRGRVKGGARQARLRLSELDVTGLGLPLEEISGLVSGEVEAEAEGGRASLDAALSARDVLAAGVGLGELELDADLSFALDGAAPDFGRPVEGHLAWRASAIEAPGGVAVASARGEVDLDAALAPSLLRGGLAAVLEAEELSVGESFLERLELAVRSDAGTLRLERISGVLRPPPAVDVTQLPFSGHGELDFDDSGAVSIAAVDRARLDLDAGDASAGVALVVAASLESGRLLVEVPSLEIAGAIESGSARAGVPLETALEIPGLADLARRVPASRRAGGEVVVGFDLASVDLRGFERWTGGEASLPEASGDARGILRFDPADPAGATGRLVLDRLQTVVQRVPIESLDPVVLRLGDHRARLAPTQLLVAERQLSATGEAELSAGWRFEDSPTEMISSFRAEVDGALQAALLEPYLAGGRAEGAINLSVVAAGDLEAMSADVTVGDAGDAAVIWDRPYVTRLASPSIEARIEGKSVVLERVSASLNEGRLDVEGRVGEVMDLRGQLEDVRYRLDYGLTIEASGAFHYKKPPEPGRLQADLVVERGTLRRRIDAGAELLDALLAPPALETGGGGDSAFGETELAIEISTREGVRVKNNLADLQVGWSPIRVEGTVDRPRIIGSLEAEPDGRVYAYGQVIRVDRGVIEFSGQPSVPAKLDVQVTTSLEDPSLATPEDQRVLASLARREDDFSTLDEGERAARVRENLASGLTTYFGDQLASRLGRALGRTELAYRPLWIFGEADPEARLVVSRDLSRYVSVGVAFDLRQADEQTYLLEVGRLPRLPSLSGTVFSNDEAELGATFQQQLTFGGGGGEDGEEDKRPRVAEIRVDCQACARIEEGSPAKAARRALSWRRGKRLDLDAAFDLEVEAAERLRREGFPDPEIDVRLEPKGEEKVDIVVRLEPGPRAIFVYEGEEPPSARQETLEALYRSDYSERASLDEIRDTAERVWRSRGHPWPEVDVTVESSPEPPPAGTRTVTVASRPGESFDFEAPRFRGVPQEVATELTSRFTSQQSRAELVAGKGGAEDRLLDALAALGYPRGSVLDRAFDRETKRPELTLEPGPRRHIDSLTLDGAPEGEEERLRNLLTVSEGEPLVGAKLAETAFALERDLRQRGWVDARVRVEVSPLPTEDEVAQRSEAPAEAVDADVRVALEPGVRQRLVKVDIDGTKVTQERWVKRLAEVEDAVEQGAYVDAGQVSQTRRRLLETRLFERVRVNVETSEEGEAVLRLDLEERPRYLAAYGVRWEESEGFGGMVDVLDRNFRGRGIGLGVRALWVRDEKSLRLYGQMPRAFNSPLDLELFVEGFDEDDEGLLAEGIELSAQVTWPLSQQTRLRSYVRYRRADVLDTRLSGEPGEPRTESVPLVGFQVLHDERDDPLDTRQGWFASADLSGSEDVVTSDNSYLRLLGQVDYFLSFGRWTWAQGARVGYAQVFDGEMPRDVRFFGGGARSLRGYASRSLGPQEVLDDGDLRARGGEGLLIFHEELRFDITAAVQGVVFLDVGNVWEDSDQWGDDLLSGVGLGVRYRSPVGLLRLDFGHALDRREGDDEVEIYFGLGHAF